MKHKKKLIAGAIAITSAVPISLYVEYQRITAVPPGLIVCDHTNDIIVLGHRCPLGPDEVACFTAPFVRTYMNFINNELSKGTITMRDVAELFNQQQAIYDDDMEECTRIMNTQ